ncbi:MAG TPA: hypothetical protein VMT18_06185 [Planctomycetota bacterium]|nr:hypothetical protein [Planctomycetota bacterium]
MIAPQERGDGGLGWLFQIVAVFVFFVLPVIRSITESRKRSAKGPRPAKPARPPAEQDGRELWREMLEGRRPQASKPARPSAPAARRPHAPVARPAPQPDVRRAADAPMPAPARPPAEAAQTPLEHAPLTGAARLPKSVPALSSFDLDPATLDDEMDLRWGASPGAAVPDIARAPAATALLAGMDWRRAVVLSEVLAPPLALRGPAAAWPGPPASLTQ